MAGLSCADELRDLLPSGEGPLFIHARVDADDQPRVVPSRDGVAIKHRFMQDRDIGLNLAAHLIPFPERRIARAKRARCR